MWCATYMNKGNFGILIEFPINSSSSKKDIINLRINFFFHQKKTHKALSVDKKASH